MHPAGRDPRAALGRRAALRPARPRGRGRRRDLRLPAEAIAGHAGRAAEAAADLSQALESGEEVFVAARPTGGVEKLRRLALRVRVPRLLGAPRPGVVVSVPAEISAGFRLREPRLALYAEEEIFGEERRSAAARRKPSRGVPLGPAGPEARRRRRARRLRHRPLQGLEARSGRGRRSASSWRSSTPRRRRCCCRSSASISCRSTRASRASSPCSTGWAARAGRGARPRSRKAMRDMTDQLLKLYARRSLADGFAFSKDSPWQKEFEDAFEYVETPDQAQAIADVKRDMQSEKPMDRLLCGDVGYGKTEVAMRAAFKAVLDGKQVAVLAPTTILADQHFRTFQRRFAALPGRRSSCSRASARAPSRRTSSRRSPTGTVDILIATHRMLGKDLAFRDLGLLDRGRGAAVRRRAEGAAQGVEGLDRRAVDVGDADPALAAPLALGPARPLDHRDAAARPARDRDAGRPLAARGHPRGDRGGDRARRARSSSCTTASSRSAASSRRSRSCCRAVRIDRRARADARGRAREGDAALLLARGGRAARDGDRRERPRHPLGQHDPDRPRRHLRPRPALPAARPRRPQRQAGLRVPAGRADRGALGGRAAAARLDPGVLRPRRGIPHRGARTSRSAARATSSAASSPATSPRSASRRTCRCSRRRSGRCAARSRSRSGRSRSRSGWTSRSRTTTWRTRAGG